MQEKEKSEIWNASLPLEKLQAKHLRRASLAPSAAVPSALILKAKFSTKTDKPSEKS